MKRNRSSDVTGRYRLTGVTRGHRRLCWYKHSTCACARRIHSVHEAPPLAVSKDETELQDYNFDLHENWMDMSNSSNFWWKLNIKCKNHCCYRSNDSNSAFNNVAAKLTLNCRVISVNINDITSLWNLFAVSTFVCTLLVSICTVRK